MKVRKVLAVLAVVALVATAFVGCGGGGAKTEPDVKIGANYELSGAVGQYGLMSLEGIKLAVEEVNAAGGIKGKQVELVIVDNKSDNNESKNCRNASGNAR